MRITWLLLVFSLVLAACAPEPSLEVSTSPTAGVTETRPIDTGDVDGFSIDTIGIDGADYLVAIADTSTSRNRGLRGVRAFGDLAGMLFVFEEPVNVAFTMNDTVTPLTLNLLDAGGTVLEVITMDLCTGQPCRFQPTVMYRYALELPQGGLSLDVGDQVTVLAPTGHA